MCGIMAYIGREEAYPIVINGLRKMEYRGYDSAGVAVMNGSLSLLKKEGKVSFLEQFAEGKKTAGQIALGHTRWATHGIPSDLNAHPHRSQSGRLVMVHNGIIENYETLKQFLLSKGFVFQSQTDTEVLVQYIEWNQQTYQLSLAEAARRALQDVEGSYAIVILDTLEPDALVVAKHDNPLAIGLGKDGIYIASDAGPISAYTQRVSYLEDQQLAKLTTKGSYEVFDLEGRKQPLNIQKIESKSAVYEKGAYDSFMLKEIFQQPQTIADCLHERISPDQQEVILPVVEEHLDTFYNANRILIVACGTSWHAGLVGEYLLEQFAQVAVEVEYASEFRYRQPVINKGDIVIGISQSGETADTLAAIKLANEKGAFTYSLVNTPESTIARHSKAVSYIRVGCEIGVASTKAFTGQVALLTLLAVKLGQIRHQLPKEDQLSVISGLKNLPRQIESSLAVASQVEHISSLVANKEHALFLGRGLNFPVALEGALKLKEISYIHAEGYPAAEMKHGPIALIDEEMPVFVMATNQSCFKKLVSNIQEIKARKGLVVLIKSADLEIADELADYVIDVPAVNEWVSPIITAIPLQLFAYYVAKLRGCNIDQPRNLAKSVTVE